MRMKSQDKPCSESLQPAELAKYFCGWRLSLQPRCWNMGRGVFVLLIPAVPMILPYPIGVNLVRRAGDRQALD